MISHGLTHEEWTAWNDVFDYLSRHADPPAPGTPEAERWWQKAADDASRLCRRWHDCSCQELVKKLMLAVYDYLGIKGDGDRER